MPDPALLLSPPARIPAMIAQPVAGLANRLTGLHRLDALYQQARQPTEEGDFLDRALDTLGVQCALTGAGVDRIPANGPLLVVANHPFGGVEGLALAQALRRRRPDLRILANYLLGRVAELAPLMIGVNPFSGSQAVRQNRRPLRQALDWLREGGTLLMFPAGAVSHLHLSRRTVTDPPWQPAAAWLARRSEARVLPVFVDGRNSAAFQAAGLLAPQLRTALLARELLRRRRCTVHARVGQCIEPAALSELADDVERTAWLRLKVYGLRGAKSARRRPAGAAATPAGAPDRTLAQEVAGLTDSHRLLRHGEFGVYLTGAAEAPRLLQEIGRQRELAFRAAGEGTGRALDLDRYDRHYQHLWLWDHAHGRLAGAYRLARIDRVLASQGPGGLYLSSLFRFRRGALAALGPALELGRSFVALEYQRDFQPLLLLWQGIGRYLAMQPQYARLVGPVSIARSYSDASRDLIAHYLSQYCADPALVGRVRGNYRPRSRPLQGFGPQALRRLVGDVEALANCVAALEGDGKSLPVLLRHYLKLGGQVLAWNVDRKFADVLDALLVVDLRRTDPRLLRRYMGAEGAQRFAAWHAGEPRQAA